jgi:hypothetical protein
MSTKNRERVARYGLETVVQMAQKYASDHQMALALTGILENLFKLSEETCTKVSSLLLVCSIQFSSVVRDLCSLVTFVVPIVVIWQSITNCYMKHIDLNFK